MGPHQVYISLPFPGADPDEVDGFCFRTTKSPNPRVVPLSFSVPGERRGSGVVEECEEHHEEGPIQVSTERTK